MPALLSEILLMLWKHLVRVDKSAILADLEVDVGTGGIAATAGCAYQRSLVNPLSAAHVDRAEVGVKCMEGGVGGIVLDDDRVAVAVGASTGIDYHTGIGGIDRVAHIGSDINAQVTSPEVIS